MQQVVVIEQYGRYLADVANQHQKCPLSRALVKILAASKTRTQEEVGVLLEQGHRLFGENRVQEADAKWPDLKARYPDIALHMIGPLQSNKVAEAVRLFDVIETLDRPKLLYALDDEASKQGKRQAVMVQVNIGEEPQKAGVAPDALPAFIADCRKVAHIELRGLMCVPPAGIPPAPYFALMQQWQREYDLAELSMGMSGDWQEAVRFGATEIRLGTALFGPRES